MRRPGSMPRQVPWLHSTMSRCNEYHTQFVNNDSPHANALASWHTAGLWYNTWCTKQW